MNPLAFLAAGISNSPVPGLPTPYLPETWMKVTYLVILYVVIPLWMSVHAWIWLHQRRYNMPPYLILRLHQWWTGAKPGKRMIGTGRHGKA